MTAAAGAEPILVRRRFPALDGLRAVGALAVLTTHVGFQSGEAVSGPFAGLLARLDAGVAVFFVISGFLLFRPHAAAWFDGRPGPRPLPYLRNRALRILPALWLAVAGAALLLDANRAVDWPTFVRHALLVHTYAGYEPVAGLTQTWSLATEAAFYLLLPVVGWISTRRRPPTRRSVVTWLTVCALMVPGGATWMAFSAEVGPSGSGLWLPGYVGWFTAGMALATWSVARGHGVVRASFLDRLARMPGTVWAGAGAIYLIAGSPIAGPYTLAPATGAEAFVKSALYACIGAALVLPAVGSVAGEDPTVVRVLGGRIGHYLGDISYGVFCYHVIVLGMVEQVGGYEPFTGGFGERFALTLAVSIVVATISYYLVERPILRWGRRDRHYDVSPGGPSSASATAPSARA